MNPIRLITLWFSCRPAAGSAGADVNTIETAANPLLRGEKRWPTGY